MENRDYKKFRKTFQKQLYKKYATQGEKAKNKICVSYLKINSNGGKPLKMRLSENPKKTSIYNSRSKEMLGQNKSVENGEFKQVPWAMDKSPVQRNSNFVLPKKGEFNEETEQTELEKNMDSLKTKNDAQKINTYTRDEINILDKVKQLIKARRQDPTLKIEIRHCYQNGKVDEKVDLQARAENGRERGFWGKVASLFGCE